MFNLNQHAISSNVNEMIIPILSPGNNRDNLINSTLSNDEDSSLSFDVLTLSMFILTYNNRLLLIIMFYKYVGKVFFALRNQLVI